jgi:hypothetical protein
MAKGWAVGIRSVSSTSILPSRLCPDQL